MHKQKALLISLIHMGIKQQRHYLRKHKQHEVALTIPVLGQIQCD